MSWVMRVHRKGSSEIILYDDDELGTMDDELTSLFITDLAGIEEITIERVD